MGREQGNDLLSDTIQREKIEAWAAYRGYEIVAWYEDIDVSGREGSRRPQFDRLLRDAKSGLFDCVAVYRLTRFARSVKQAAQAYTELLAAKVDLVSVTEDIDTTTASGKFMQNILFAMAEFESERIAEEWRNVHANRRRRGLANVTKHITGYRQNGTAELLEVEPDEAAMVRTAYTMRAAGRTYSEIVRRIQADGHRTRLGLTRLNYGTLSGILRNPVYAGMLRDADGSLIPGAHEAIVERELWDRVQLLSPAARRNNRFRGSLLSGLLVCSGCGYTMSYQPPSSRKQFGSTYARRSHYRCSARSRSEPCPRTVTIDAVAADGYVEEAFRARFSSKRMQHGGRLKQTVQQREWQGRLSRMNARIAELDLALDRLAEQRYLKGTLPAAEHDRQARRWLSERAELEAKVRELQVTAATVRPIERKVLDLWDQYPVEVKRQALRIAIDRITVLPAPRRGKSVRGHAHDRLDVVWLQ